jgi:hypothetical protein
MNRHFVDLSCIAGIALIFSVAAIYRTNFYWIGGIGIMLIIMVFRIYMGEMKRYLHLMLTLLSWICTIISICLIIK